MLDRFGRKITYLRMSVTEQCNLRCRYCMPADDKNKKNDRGYASTDCMGDLCACDRPDTEQNIDSVTGQPIGTDSVHAATVLSTDEMIMAVRAAASLGISKVRITGGEPLVRHDIVSICERTAAVPGIEEVCITTNGLFLAKYAKELEAAGVRHVNISLDTLDPDKYEYITGRSRCRYTLQSSRDGAEVADTFSAEGSRDIAEVTDTFSAEGRRDGAEVADTGKGTSRAETAAERSSGAGGPERVLAGLEAAIEAGFKKVKINTVLIGGFNDNEIKELAELTCKYPVDVRFIELMPMTGGVFGPEVYISADEVLKCFDSLEKAPDEGVARMYRLPGAKGCIGLISPVTSHFCAECNRLRLTADGRLKPCLHSRAEYSIVGLDEDGIRKRMEEAILAKPEMHPKLSHDSLSEAGRSMNRIGG